MAGYLKVREEHRDDELGIIRKEITLPGGFTFESPSRSVARAAEASATIVVNEIPKKVTPDIVASLETGTSNLFRDVKSKFLSNAFNLTIFDLKFDSVPPPTAVRTIAQYLYSSSDRVVMLPTVKTGLLQDQAKSPKFLDARIDAYIKMMSDIIDQTEAGNNKPIIGTVPLVPAKFSRRIIQAYRSKGVEAFAIDAGTKDILFNEPDFRIILAEINNHKPLTDVFLYACNLGFPHFEMQATRADDFLGIFAYIDVLGGTFKTRGGPMGIGAKPPEPKAKVFSREKYAYELSSYEKVRQRFGRPMSPAQLQNHNQLAQLQEANQVRSFIGQQSVRQYVASKSAIDYRSLNPLMSIAKVMTRSW